jgi:hypothetical protein
MKISEFGNYTWQSSFTFSPSTDILWNLFPYPPTLSNKRASTYLCEKGFSSLTQIKTKYQNRLDVCDNLSLLSFRTPNFLLCVNTHEMFQEHAVPLFSASPSTFMRSMAFSWCNSEDVHLNHRKYWHSHLSFFHFQMLDSGYNAILLLSKQQNYSSSHCINKSLLSWCGILWYQLYFRKVTCNHHFDFLVTNHLSEITNSAPPHKMHSICVTYKCEKAVPLIKHHTTKMYTGSGGRAPYILTFFTRCSKWSAVIASLLTTVERVLVATSQEAGCGPKPVWLLRRNLWDSIIQTNGDNAKWNREPHSLHWCHIKAAARLPQQRPGSDSMSHHVGSVVAMEYVFSKYFHFTNHSTLINDPIFWCYRQY